MQLAGLRTIHEKGQILSELTLSSIHKNVVGIFIAGEDELVTIAVSHIKEDGSDPLIFFNDLDLHGYPLDKNPCQLSHIKSVVPFKTKYDDPVYLKIRELKTSTNGLAA
jgi:hypothetical protein